MQRSHRRPSRRWWAAVAASLLVHLALALWVAAQAPATRPHPPRPTPRAPELVWVDVAPRAAPPANAAPATGHPATVRLPAPRPPTAEPPARPQHDGSRREPDAAPVAATPGTGQSRAAELRAGAGTSDATASAQATPPDATPAQASIASAESNASPSASSGSTAGDGAFVLPPDAPLVGSLVVPGGGARDTFTGTAAAPRGRTLHPEDLPTAAELRAQEEERVGALVQGDAERTLAEARVERGLPDPYFGDLRRQLAKDTADAPDFTDVAKAENLPRSWRDSWQTAAQNWARTGVAYDAPVGRTALPEIPSVLAQEAARGSPDAMALAMKLTAGARFRDFGEGKMGAELYAEVELRQGSTGKLQGATLVRASGISTFDAWVVEKAATAVDALGPLDPAQHPKGLRSVFAFSGRVSYMRKVGDLKAPELGKDLAYLAGMTLLSAIPYVGQVMPGPTGTFDEVSGQATFVDLRNPHYECRVHLVRAYDGLD